MSSPEHKQLIWNLIHDIKVGMLVTKEQSNDDSMRARPMHLVQDDYDGTLYFFTPKDDAKVFEIQKDQDVCITFSDPDNSVYVSMTGKAQLSDDKDLIDKYWNEWAAAWFEGGKNDPKLGMLKVKINKGEHWDTKESKMIQMFEVAKAKDKTGVTPDIGVNEKFGVHN
ncbi:MAG TPA: pyridoxamine 5'-phosphate oxidase family protein [Saprospiraceae bacterium]|nr:pyridoxamine 5'-phosphate oxidase family protein [Saprospiraceae bacterium]